MKRMSEKYGIDVAEGDKVNTGEVAADGSKYTENVSFASFKNPIEGFLGKKAFLETNVNYKKALNPENTADEFAQGLKDAGYATDPSYVSSLRSIWNGKMRTTRPEWMEPTRKSNVPQTEWTMTVAQPTEGSRAGLVEQKKSTSKNPIIAEYENFILAPEETKEWWYNIYKDDLESGKITEAELDKQIAIDKKEKNLEFQEYQKDPLAFIQNELTYALENREEGDSPYIASLEKVFTAAKSDFKKETQSPVPEKIDLQSAEEMRATINPTALQEWNNLQKQNWSGVKEWDPKGVEMLKAYNKKMGVNYNPTEAWSAITISNAVMAASGANSRDEIRAKGFNPSKGHSYYISDAFKTSKNPDYKYNKYKAEKLSGNYNIGDILVKGRKPKKGIDTSKWTYEDFASHGPGYSSHTDIIVDKGTDDKGEYVIIAGGNVGDTYINNKIYVKDIPAKRYKATLRDRASIKPSFTINPVKEELVLNPFTGEKESSADDILNDITYNPKMPRMIGYTDESASNYLKDRKNYEDAVQAQLAAEEEKNYQSSTDNYEKFAAENAANEEIIPKMRVLPEVQVDAKKRDNTEEVIPLEKPVQPEINMEYLNSIPDVNSSIVPGSFTNESRSKEELKKDAEAEEFIMSPLEKKINSGFFGSGQSMFYPSMRQNRNGGAMAPNIPTWNYPSKGAFVRDTTDAPPRMFDNGGKIYPRYFNNGGDGDGDEEQKLTNPIVTNKGVLGMLSSLGKYKVARASSKMELPEQGNMSDYEYFSSLTYPQQLAIGNKEAMALRDKQSEEAHANQVRQNMIDIGKKLAAKESGMKEDFEYLDIPWMGQVKHKERIDEYGKSTMIVDPSSSWFHKIPSKDYTGYQTITKDDSGNEIVKDVLDPYTCIGTYCAIGRKAGARMTGDSKYGQEGDLWPVLTGNYIVDDPKVSKAMGLYEKPEADMEIGDAVRLGFYSPQGTGHTMMVSGKPVQKSWGLRVPTTYGSHWSSGVYADSWYDGDNLGDPDEFLETERGKDDYDAVVGYEGKLPEYKKNLEKAQDLATRFRNYKQESAISSLPLIKQQLSYPSRKLAFNTAGREYPNTRKGRKQKERDDAYIQAYLDKMQKK